MMETTSSQTRRRVVLIIVLGLALYAVLPQITGFQDSLKAVKGADTLDLVISFMAVAASYLFAGLTYWLLASKRLKYYRTVLLEIAATFINRLLPAGIGGMGVNYVYLRKNKHSLGAAASIVAINNLLGFIGHMILFWGIYMILNPKLPERLHFQALQIAGLMLVVLIVSTWVLLGTSLGKRFQKQIGQVRKQLAFYRQNKRRLPLGLLSSMGLTFCVALAFYFCVTAFNLNIDFPTCFLIFTAGFAVGNATPTPGGLGGVEAGLALGLMAYDVPKVEALAVVLVFRVISFWLPTAIGALAFLNAQQKQVV